jgi:hypothetical protein
MEKDDNPHKCMKRAVFVSFLIVAASLAQAAVVDGVGIITTMTGSGEVVTSVGAVPMVVGSKSKQGDTVLTRADSKADLMFSNGIKLMLQPETTLTLTLLKQVEGTILPPSLDNKSQKELGASLTEVEVINGKVVGDVKKLASESVFTLKTPVGVISIKGTVFSVEFKTNKDGTVSFGVGCLVGRVQVQMADPKSAPLTIPAGQKLTMTAPAPAPVGSQDKPAAAQNKGEKGDKQDSAPPEEAPVKPMQFMIAPLPPAEAKELALRAPDQPPPPPAPPASAPAEAQKASALDKIIQNMEQSIQKGQVNTSPTGG